MAELTNTSILTLVYGTNGAHDRRSPDGALLQGQNSSPNGSAPGFDFGTGETPRYPLASEASDAPTCGAVGSSRRPCGSNSLTFASPLRCANTWNEVHRTPRP